LLRSASLLSPSEDLFDLELGLLYSEALFIFEYWSLLGSDASAKVTFFDYW
jgi:hypothetical protein